MQLQSFRPSSLAAWLVLAAILIAVPIEARITWQQCDDLVVNTTLAYDCANVTVPLDYADPESNATLALRLARVPATGNSTRGSILFNFGGPGDSGHESLLSQAPYLLASTGQEYDLIAIEPRGTGRTLTLQCGQTDLEVLSVVHDLSNWDPGQLWASSEVVANACYESSKEVGSLVGTAYVARDHIQVVDALEEDGMLRYWGISYGTVLGATIASMFPERVDKLTLDGVANPHDYYHSLCVREGDADADKEFSAIFEFCAQAGPQNCSLMASGKHGTTGAELESAFWDFVESLKTRPITLAGISVLDYPAMKAMVKLSLYQPQQWPTYTTLFAAFMDGDLNSTAVIEQAVSSANVTEQVDIFRSLYATFLGITCGDHTGRVDTLDELLPAINEAHQASRSIGDGWDTACFPCARWKMGAKERYMGDFNVATKNPVLLLTNTFDGITPRVSAVNVSMGLEGSRLLTINGYGHSSTATPSTCLVKNHVAYWTNGTLPDEGTVCELDGLPYLITWADVLESLQ